MGVEVVTYEVRSRINGKEYEIELEAILDDGELRAGSDFVRRFWCDGFDRPLYLGHLLKAEQEALVAAVRTEAENMRKLGKKPYPAESRWGM